MNPRLTLELGTSDTLWLLLAGRTTGTSPMAFGFDPSTGDSCRWPVFPSATFCRASQFSPKRSPLRIRGELATVTGRQLAELRESSFLVKSLVYPWPGSYVTILDWFNGYGFLVIKNEPFRTHLSGASRTLIVSPHVLRPHPTLAEHRSRVGKVR